MLAQSARDVTKRGAKRFLSVNRFRIRQSRVDKGDPFQGKRECRSSASIHSDADGRGRTIGQTGERLPDLLLNRMLGIEISLYIGVEEAGESQHPRVFARAGMVPRGYLLRPQAARCLCVEWGMMTALKRCLGKADLLQELRDGLHMHGLATVRAADEGQLLQGDPEVARGPA
jgi:hypothetical protein